MILRMAGKNATPEKPGINETVLVMTDPGIPENHPARQVCEMAKQAGNVVTELTCPSFEAARQAAIETEQETSHDAEPTKDIEAATTDTKEENLDETPAPNPSAEEHEATSILAETDEQQTPEPEDNVITEEPSTTAEIDEKPETDSPSPEDEPQPAPEIETETALEHDAENETESEETHEPAPEPAIEDSLSDKTEPEPESEPNLEETPETEAEQEQDAVPEKTAEAEQEQEPNKEPQTETANQPMQIEGIDDDELSEDEAKDLAYRNDNPELYDDAYYDTTEAKAEEEKTEMPKNPVILVAKAGQWIATQTGKQTELGPIDQEFPYEFDIDMTRPMDKRTMHTIQSIARQDLAKFEQTGDATKVHVVLNPTLIDGHLKIAGLDERLGNPMRPEAKPIQNQGPTAQDVVVPGIEATKQQTSQSKSEQEQIEQP
jgi:hypothetical protein